MPVRKSATARTEVLQGTTAGVASGFTYIGFPKGGVDSEIEAINEVCYAGNTAIAGTSIRLVQYDLNGVIKNDITTPTVTTVVGKAVDATLSTNTVNAGANFPWNLAPGDSVFLTAVTGTAQTVNVTLTIATKGA